MWAGRSYLGDERAGREPGASRVGARTPGPGAAQGCARARRGRARGPAGVVPTRSVGGAGAPAPAPCGQRSARFTAEMIAFSDAVVIDGSMPTPQRVWSPTAHSTYAAAVASPPADSACSA